MQKKKFDIYNWSNYLVFLAILVFFGIFGNNFLALKTIYSTINNGSPLILITCGVTFSLLVGIIDMSVAAIGYASGVVSGLLMMAFDLPFPIVFVISVAVGVFLAWINSLLFVRLKLNAMLVSLGMMLVIRAIARIFTNDNTVVLGDHVKYIRQAKVAALGGFHYTLFALIAVIVVCQFILKHTAFGRKLLLVGNDENVAKRIGINTEKVKTQALLCEGALCGIAGAFWLVTQGSIVTTGLNNYEFLALAAACLGGTSLLGGRGSFFPSAVIGALILLFLQAGMSNMGINIFVMPFVRGLIIFIAMYVDSIRTKKMMGSKLS